MRRTKGSGGQPVWNPRHQRWYLKVTIDGTRRSMSDTDPERLEARRDAVLAAREPDHRDEVAQDRRAAPRAPGSGSTPVWNAANRRWQVKVTVNGVRRTLTGQTREAAEARRDAMLVAVKQPLPHPATTGARRPNGTGSKPVWNAPKKRWQINVPIDGKRRTLIGSSVAEVEERRAALLEGAKS